APMVANANGVGSDVGMKNGREHAALRRSARIVARENNFDHVAADGSQFAVHHSQAGDSIFELVAFGRVAFGLNQTNAGMAAHVLLEPAEVGAQAAQANVAHCLGSSMFLSGSCKSGGTKSSRVGKEMAKPRPSAKRLSPVRVLMPISRP